jgi:hypothetical protein
LASGWPFFPVVAGCVDGSTPITAIFGRTHIHYSQLFLGTIQSFQGLGTPIIPVQDAGLGGQQRSLGPGDSDGPAAERGDAEAGDVDSAEAVDVGMGHVVQTEWINQP